MHGTSTPRGNRQPVQDPERTTLNARDGCTARVRTDGREAICADAYARDMYAARELEACLKPGHVRLCRACEQRGP
ncbi:hypothetical protein Bca52824_017711 [Brassica carinata]|uniref:Uncharacterized protein n=1 Tax=Brassica carinata TaxID=52824 RepID=A0A8X8AVN6_BRACI|nr:hypothetical protein Bca52824_017711 [Brassica carinata]